MTFDLTNLHHIGIVCDDVEMAATTMLDVYGIDVALFGESPYTCVVGGETQDTVQRTGLSAGPPFVELIRTVPGSPIWQPVPGVHHLGFVVDDLAAASDALARRGAPLWMAGAKNGCVPAGAVYHRDPLGTVVELLDNGTAERLAARRAAHTRGI